MNRIQQLRDTEQKLLNAQITLAKAIAAYGDSNDDRLELLLQGYKEMRDNVKMIQVQIDQAIADLF